MTLTSPLCRIGRKRSVRTVLKSKSPKDFKIYVEPFVGTGDMYFYYNLDTQKAILNDKETLVTESLQIIKKNPNIENINKFNNMSVSQIQSFVNKSHTSPIDKLAKNIYLLCHTFGGLTKNKKIYKDSNITSKLKQIPKLSEYMKNTKITNADWSTTFKYDSPSTFFFIDPPYEKSSGLYKSPIIDYKKLNEKLKKLKGKFMLTMNDSKEVRELFSSFYIRGITIKGRGNKGVGVSERKEVIITNY